MLKAKAQKSPVKVAGVRLTQLALSSKLIFPPRHSSPQYNNTTTRETFSLKLGLVRQYSGSLRCPVAGWDSYRFAV
jgi:hypothetical protein